LTYEKISPILISSTLNQRSYSILAKHTNQPLERIRRDTDRDFFMDGQQAKEYGIIDEFIAKAEKIQKIEPKTKGNWGKKGER
jgi:ATP-dependent Clp protease protease subunit